MGNWLSASLPDVTLPPGIIHYVIYNGEIKDVQVKYLQNEFKFLLDAARLFQIK